MDAPTPCIIPDGRRCRVCRMDEGAVYYTGWTKMSCIPDGRRCRVPVDMNNPSWRNSGLRLFVAETFCVGSKFMLGDSVDVFHLWLHDGLRCRGSPRP